MSTVLLFALAGCPHPPAVTGPVDGDRAVEGVAAYRAFALAPARIAPPTLDAMSLEAEDGSVRATATLIRPEDADWNRWTDGGPRLFNNRAALLFQVRIAGPGPIAWSPDDTTLEVNDDRTVLTAAPNAEVLLADLLYYAFLEERWAADGDLVNRTRGAGPYRSAYLPPQSTGQELTGLIAFPLTDREGPLPEIQVAALRLTIPIDAGDGPHDLVWVFR